MYVRGLPLGIAVRRAACLAGLVLLLLGQIVRAEDTDVEDVHVRGLADVPAVVRWLAAEADRIEAVQILVAFDAMVFAPPPDTHEFNRHEDLAADLPTWLNALDLWARTSKRPIRITSSLNPVSVAAGEHDWRARVEAIVRRPWWEDDRIPRLEAAVSWMKRLLQRTDCLLQHTTRRSPRLLVYVAGRRAPERWISQAAWLPEERGWRRKLLPVGDAFNAETVAPMLERKGCRLYVVSPEAFFGDHVPYCELPVLPWTSRPRLLPYDFADGAQVEGIEEGGTLRLPYPEIDPVIRRLLDSLRDRLGHPGMVVVGPDRFFLRPTSILVPGHSSRARFLGAPPLYFDLAGDRLLASDHTPSGYGTWSYVRAAAETNGRYVIYPRGKRPLADVCPRDDDQLAALAPEPLHPTAYLARREGDPALDLMCDVASRLAPLTAWADRWFDVQAAPGWSDFVRARPLRLAKGSPRLPHPWQGSLWPGYPRADRMAQHVLDEALPAYDAALEEVDDAIAAIDRGEDERSHARSVANLRRFRFDLALSSFHMQAFATAILDLGQPRASWIRLQGLGRRMRLLPAIRLSDCLDAYDGRKITPAEEATHAGWTPAEHRGYQGNLLGIPPTSAAFRAKRSLARVLLWLDPRLRPRAARLIRAARNVMTHLARTPWGWGVYYTDAYTFTFVDP